VSSRSHMNMLYYRLASYPRRRSHPVNCVRSARIVQRRYVALHTVIIATLLSCPLSVPWNQKGQGCRTSQEGKVKLPCGLKFHGCFYTAFQTFITMLTRMLIAPLMNICICTDMDMAAYDCGPSIHNLLEQVSICGGILIYTAGR
jgi:hypothetical protein